MLVLVLPLCVPTLGSVPGTRAPILAERARLIRALRSMCQAGFPGPSPSNDRIKTLELSFQRPWRPDPLQQFFPTRYLP